MIDILTPLNLLILILATFLTTILVGHASVKAIREPINTLFGIRINVALEGTLEKLLVYSAVGFAFVILYTIVLSLFSFLNQIGVLVIIGFSLVIESISLVKRKKETGESISDHVRLVRKNIVSLVRRSDQVFLVLVLVVAIIWYFYPAIGLSCYPGGDDRAYVFVAKQIVDRGTLFIAIDYPYAYPFMDHLLTAGFMAVTSFFYNLLQVVGLSATFPILDLFLPLVFLSLTPGSIYVLTLGLSKNKGFSVTVALTALFIWKSITLYFSWGGVAEALGYFLIPVFGLIDYRLNSNLIGDRLRVRLFTGTLIVKFILLAVTAYIHIYSLFLFVFLVMVVTPVWTLKNHLRYDHDSMKDKVKNYFRIVSPYLLVLLGLISIMAGALTLSELSGNSSPVIGRLRKLFFSDPQDILKDLSQERSASDLVFRNGYGLDYAIFMLGSVLNQYLGGLVFLLILLYLLFVVSLSMRNKENPLSAEQRVALKLTDVMAAAGLIFFLFIQDSPFGWYYLPYPMAESVLAIRLYYEFSVFMIYVEALPIYLICFYAWKMVVNSSKRHERRSDKGLRQSDKRHARLKKAGTTAVAIVFVASIFFFSITNDYSSYVYSREESVVLPDDLDAFHWIEANTPTNATFFVDLGDAGGYVYVYSGRIVLPPEAMRAWNASYQSLLDFNEMQKMLQEGNISLQLIQLLEGYNVSYIYVGEKVQYQGLPFNSTALMESPYFDIAFHQSGTWIFKIKEP